MQATSATLFISDLHLEPARETISEIFFRFVALDAKKADALYILGDLFEIWIGDDDANDLHTRVSHVLRGLSDSGVPVFFMHGNRDFLIRDGFAKSSGCTLLPDPCEVDLYGRKALLTHGDILCTQDIAYQNYRRLVRDPTWQQQFLTKSLDERRIFAQELRLRSQAETSTKTNMIMDVCQTDVENLMRTSTCATLIHGHTHRPGRHSFLVDQRPVERIVLADWYQSGSYLRVDKQGFTVVPLD